MARPGLAFWALSGFGFGISSPSSPLPAPPQDEGSPGRSNLSPGGGNCQGAAQHAHDAHTWYRYFESRPSAGVKNRCQENRNLPYLSVDFENFDHLKEHCPLLILALPKAGSERKSQRGAWHLSFSLLRMRETRFLITTELRTWHLNTRPTPSGSSNARFSPLAACRLTESGCTPSTLGGAIDHNLTSHRPFSDRVVRL